MNEDKTLLDSANSILTSDERFTLMGFFSLLYKLDSRHAQKQHQEDEVNQVNIHSQKNKQEFDAKPLLGC